MTILILSFNGLACENIKIAHSNLLKSNFSLNKNVEVRVDNESKIKFKNAAKYINGSLSYSKKRVSFSADDFTYKEDHKESFLVTGFTCEDITVDGELVVINILKENIKHTSYFIYRSDKLTTMNSTAEIEVGFLFFNWYVKNIEDYSNFKLLY